MGRIRPGDRYDREGRCNQSWEYIYGTEQTGNLPQFTKQHIGNVYMPCPYSTQAIFDVSTLPLGWEAQYGPVDIYQRSQALLGFVPDTLVDHTRGDGKVVYMSRHYSGVWGYLCTFDGCSYYLENNKRYFYI